jgi:mRNA-degrading endonuclease toxin of MazEF toxin-antitoxin module
MLWAGVTLAACAGPSVPPATEHDAAPPADAPIVAAQPGAWFDAQGGLVVVGAGRRLRLVLSAPVVACEPAFALNASAPERAERASLPFRVVSEACRTEHPSVLLPEESLTASPAELERNYQEVARCAAEELGTTSGWVPDVVAASDPCPTALGLGWRLPHAAELQGLTVDDRKAIAGALFEAEAGAGFGSLLLYARAPNGELTLVTLSPNSSEQAPSLGETRRSKPFFGAALRCVPTSRATADGARPAPPPLPHALECLRALRQQQAALRPASATVPLLELQKLKAWVESVQRSPAVVESDVALRELAQLLAAPAVDRLAREAREERALTEHYAELAEGIDDPNVSAGERARRRAEFDNLRKRLGGQLVQTPGSANDRTQLAALLTHLVTLLQSTLPPKPGKKSPKTHAPDYRPLLTRLRELRGEKAPAP